LLCPSNRSPIPPTNNLDSFLPSAFGKKLAFNIDAWFPDCFSEVAGVDEVP
jgi:hypothetical protein